MSTLNNNGKGNILLSYLFSSDNIIENINIAQQIQDRLSLFANKLKEEGLIKKWVVAPDDLISEKYIRFGENIVDDWVPITENCELPSPHTPVLVSLKFSNGVEDVDIDEINEDGHWESFDEFVIAWKYKPQVYRKE